MRATLEGLCLAGVEMSVSAHPKRPWGEAIRHISLGTGCSDSEVTGCTQNYIQYTTWVEICCPEGKSGDF